MPLTTVTPPMVEALNEHAQICQAMGIQPVRYLHRTGSGKLTTDVTTGNIRYRGVGAKVSAEREVEREWQIWWVHIPFIRGMERTEVWGIGDVSVAMEQSQFPALSVDGQLLEVEPEDYIVDQAGTYWRVVNPVISPDLGWYSAITMVLN